MTKCCDCENEQVEHDGILHDYCEACLARWILRIRALVEFVDFKAVAGVQ